MPLTFGSLFSGIGGLDRGLERAGMVCRWQVEIDPYARRVLAKHWPDVPKYGDIREVDFERVEKVDLLCGGFPCQPVSLAGKGLAQSDPRWLWPEFTRAIRDVRPRYVLVENVPGLLGRGMGGVLGDLAGLGFDAEWESLPAAAFGAPHIRERVFVVAYARQQQGKQRHNLDMQRGWTGQAQQVGLGSTQFWKRPSDCGWWATEPAVGRVVDGVPHRVDRRRGLGNAVVPQVAQWVGERIAEFDSLEVPPTAHN